MNDKQQQQLSLIKTLVQTRDDAQKSRIQFQNRLRALTQDPDAPISVDDVRLEMVTRWAERFSDLEEAVNKEIASVIASGEADSLFRDVTAIRGLGDILAARLLAEIDWEKARTASSLWKYAGYAPGHDKRVKGQKIQYNPQMRMICYLIGTSFLRSRSPYRAVYDTAKERYQATRPDWTKAHIHAASMRAMMKRFLVHLYIVGRSRHGLSVRRPYVETHLGHVHLDNPTDYGWPAINVTYMDEHNQYEAIYD